MMLAVLKPVIVVFVVNQQLSGKLNILQVLLAPSLFEWTVHFVTVTTHQLVLLRFLIQCGG
jgi:hypothetical protein